MVAGVLTAVFVGVALNIRERVRGSVADKLEAGQRMLSELEHRRARELSVQVATLAENPTLKAAVANYKLEGRTPNSRFRRGMLTAIERELEKLAARTATDVLAVTDASGKVLAVGGRRDADWPLQAQVMPRHGESGSAYVSMASGVFQFASAPLALQQHFLGTLQLAKGLDGRYAQELSTLSGAATLIASGDKVIATTLSADLVKALTPETIRALPQHPIVLLAGSEYAVKLLFQDGEAQVYALDSIGASTSVPMQEALRAVLIIAVGAFALAGFASVWLARTISRPIDTLSTSLSEMTVLARLRPSGAGDRLLARGGHAHRRVQHHDAIGQLGRGRDPTRLRRRHPGPGARAGCAGPVHRRPLGARRHRVGGHRAADAPRQTSSSASCGSARCCTTSGRLASATPCCASPVR